jgi:hypothetical protein
MPADNDSWRMLMFRRIRIDHICPLINLGFSNGEFEKKLALFLG